MEQAFSDDHSRFFSKVKKVKIVPVKQQIGVVQVK